MSDTGPGELPDAELLAAALAAACADETDEGEVRWALVRALHRRPTGIIFEQARSWCSGSRAVERTLGADILAQLGTTLEGGPVPFAHESAQILSQLLCDAEEGVLMSALFALGHLGAGEPAAIAKLAQHVSAGVRHAVAYALGGRDDGHSINVLIALTSDPDAEVRDWATFGLGSLSTIDSHDVRDSLFARLSDTDEEVRGEALVGLACRGDRRVVPLVIAELKKGKAGRLIFEAAERLVENYPNDDELREALGGKRHDAK